MLCYEFAIIEYMNTKQHTPSAGGIIINDGNVLLIYSASRNTYAFPKGTIDEGETKDTTAVREVKEETGYNVKILELVGDYTFEFDANDGVHYQKTVTYYLMELADDSEPRPNLQAGEDFVNIWTPIENVYDILSFNDAKEIFMKAIGNSGRVL
jgi:8-oxo-dGTP pyrophosphatase MutT (NUDIX family)